MRSAGKTNIANKKRGGGRRHPHVYKSKNAESRRPPTFPGADWRQVSSALRSLTTVFGMGTGVARVEVPPGLCALRTQTIGRGPRQRGPDLQNVIRDSYSFQARLCASEVFQQRLISTARLKPLRALHLRPINQVISLEPMKPNLEEGFALRCFQRLSSPNAATQRCPWQDNWYTGGSCIPVLSY